MKTCKKCGKKIEDDALVCPYCGCVNRDNKKGRTEPEVTRSSGGSEPPKKRKTWLWILGWLFIFPLPLTILLLRNQKLNKIVKYIIIAVAWLFYRPVLGIILLVIAGALIWFLGKKSKEKKAQLDAQAAAAPAAPAAAPVQPAAPVQQAPPAAAPVPPAAPAPEYPEPPAPDFSDAPAPPPEFPDAPVE